MKTKTLTEELQEKALKKLDKQFRYGLQKQVNSNFDDCTPEVRELLKQEVADLIQTVLKRVEGELYEVDVDKAPTIQDEAWANQYDSKSQAFWYGEAQAIINIKEAIIRLQQSD